MQSYTAKLEHKSHGKVRQHEKNLSRFLSKLVFALSSLIGRLFFFLQGDKELNKNTLNLDLCREKEVGCLCLCRRKEVGCLRFLHGKFRLVRSRSRPKKYKVSTKLFVLIPSFTT